MMHQCLICNETFDFEWQAISHVIDCRNNHPSLKGMLSDYLAKIPVTKKTTSIANGVLKQDNFTGAVTNESGEEWHYKEGKPIIIYGPKDSYKCVIVDLNERRKAKAS